MSPVAEHPSRPATADAAHELLAAAGRRVRELGAGLAALYVIVVAVAGASAIALLGWPAHSGSYFSWDLGATAAIRSADDLGSDAAVCIAALATLGIVAAALH